MRPKVCDICFKMIERGNNEIVNGDKVSLEIIAKTKSKETHFDICQECFYRRFSGESIQINVDRQILAESEDKQKQ